VLIILLLLFGGENLASAQAINEDFRASTNMFLRQLASAKHLRMGDNFVNSISGINALNSNPAGLSFINRNRLVTNVSRFRALLPSLQN
jgi:hypothetical protein